MLSGCLLLFSRSSWCSYPAGSEVYSSFPWLREGREYVAVAQRTRAGGGTDESRHVCCLCDLRAWRVLVSTSLHMRNVVPMRDVRR